MEFSQNIQVQRKAWRITSHQEVKLLEIGENLTYLDNKKFLDSTNKEMNLKRLNTMKTVNERTTYTSKKVIVANVCASESFGA